MSLEDTRVKMENRIICIYIYTVIINYQFFFLFEIQYCQNTKSCFPTTSKLVITVLFHLFIKKNSSYIFDTVSHDYEGKCLNILC